MDEAIQKAIKRLNTAVETGDFARVAEYAGELVCLPVDEIGIQAFRHVSVICGFALSKLERFEEAKRVLIPLLEKEIAVIDAAYLLFSIAFAEQSREDLVYYGSRFLEAVPEPANPPECVTTAVQNGHEICTNLASVYLEENRYDEAVDVLMQGLRFKQDFPLLYINLGIARHRCGDSTGAEEILHEGREKCSEPKEIDRILGLVYHGNHRYGDAEKTLVRARESGSSEALYDLGVLYHQLLKIYDAEESLEKYLQYNPGSSDASQLLEEIRSLQFFGKPEPRISVAVMVNSGMRGLRECVLSFRDAADEILVAGTGKEPADMDEKYAGASYCRYRGKGGAGSLRDFAVSMSSGEWIFLTRVDERLAPGDIPKLRAVKWQSSYDVVCCSLFARTGGDVVPAHFGRRYVPRLFRKNPERAESEHEDPLLSLPENTAISDIRVYDCGHLKNPGTPAQREKQALSELLRLCGDSPEDPYSRLEAARRTFATSMPDKASELALDCVRLSEKNPEKYDFTLLKALHLLSDISLCAGDILLCTEYCTRALSFRHDYPGALLQLGKCAFVEGHCDEAVSRMESYLAVRTRLINDESFDVATLDDLGRDYEAHYLLGAVFLKQNMLDSAREHFEKSLEGNHMAWMSSDGLGRIFLKKHEYEKAAEAFENALLYGYLNTSRYGAPAEARREYERVQEAYARALRKADPALKKPPAVRNILADVNALPV